MNALGAGRLLIGLVLFSAVTLGLWLVLHFTFVWGGGPAFAAAWRPLITALALGLGLVLSFAALVYRLRQLDAANQNVELRNDPVASLKKASPAEDRSWRA